MINFCIAQIGTKPFDVEGNERLITDLALRARQDGYELIVFPELALSGYYCLDHTFNQNFLLSQKEAVFRIAERTKGISVIIGLMRAEDGALRSNGRPVIYNSAAFLEDGRIIGYQDKRLLPDYDVFDETRYFVPGKTSEPIRSKLGNIGLLICEDMWTEGYTIDPGKELLEKGAQVLVNISASPYEKGKFDERIKLARRYKAPFLYVNTVGGFDGYEGEIVFDGRSFFLGSGGEFVLGFGESGVFSKKDGVSGRLSEIAEVYEALILGIKSYLTRNNIESITVGVSGGIDSAVVAALATKCTKTLNLISMPTRFNSDSTKSDAVKLAQNLESNFFEFPIEDIYQRFSSKLSQAFEVKEIALENLQSRLRMATLFTFSNSNGSLVLNTGNKTELALGYTTAYGDLSGALSVLGDVNKREVYDLARFINREKEIIPSSIITREPSAELRDNQTDAQGMGGRPQDIADLVDVLIEGGEVEDTALTRKLKKLLASSEWKRRQAPPAIKVSRKAFGHGRRVPM